jgi:hypothetical protein
MHGCMRRHWRIWINYPSLFSLFTVGSRFLADPTAAARLSKPIFNKWLAIFTFFLRSCDDASATSRTESIHWALFMRTRGGRAWNHCNVTERWQHFVASAPKWMAKTRDALACCIATAASAEVRVEGNLSALRVSASGDALSNVLSAFGTLFPVKTRTAVPLTTGRLFGFVVPGGLSPARRLSTT